MTARIKKFFAENKKTVWLCAALLLVLIAATAAVLVSALLHSGDGADLTVNLFSGEARTVNMRAEMEKNARASSGITGLAFSGSPRLTPLGVKEPITIEDNTQVWDTETLVDIFKLEYKDGELADVASSGGDHVIAPGTENSFTFYVKNNGSGAADYQIVIEAFVSGLPDGRPLPVEARFRGPGGYFIGSADDPGTAGVNEERWDAVLMLDGIEDAQVLSTLGSSEYVLDWRWPFESGDDEFDTLLGNLSAENPITLTIRISTVANYHEPEVTVFAPVPSRLNGKDHFAYLFGYPDGNICPEKNITRAETAVIFYRLLNDDVREPYRTNKTSYTDVPADAWYNEAVATLSHMGILNGYGDGTFRPNDTITRAEFATISARLSDYEPFTGKTKFTDIEGHWAEEYICICERNGWFYGYEDNTFRPQNTIIRAEAATVINRILHRLPEKRSDLTDEVIFWPDNADESAWYYLAMQEASESHDYIRGTGTREFWKEPVKKTEQLRDI